MTDPRIDELRQLLPLCMLSDWVRLGARAARWVREGRPEGDGAHPLDRLLEQARSSIERREYRALTMPRRSIAGSAISSAKEDIVAAIRAHQAWSSPVAGSGKTTQFQDVPGSRTRCPGDDWLHTAPAVAALSISGAS